MRPGAWLAQKLSAQSGPKGAGQSQREGIGSLLRSLPKLDASESRMPEKIAFGTLIAKVWTEELPRAR